MAQITSEEMQLLSKLVFDNSGISLDKDKGYLLETRLRPLLGAYGLGSLKELYAHASADNSGKVLKEIVEAMTTNETFFFRDNTPFDLMRNKIIPDLIDRRNASGFGHGCKIPIRIWSAACSTGQEVYSIAMTLIEMLGDLSRYDIHILGTDIADKVVAQASYGKYNQFEMDRGLPLHYRNRYFTPLGGDWRISDEVRSLAQFRTLNLMKPFPDLGGKFDLIFCRNVAIYFNAADKVRLFQKIARVMQADGALIVGGSETLVGIAPELESKSYLKGIFYQLAGAVSNSAPPPRPPVVSRSPKAAMPPPRVAPRPRPAPTAMERNEPAAVAPPITSSPAGQGDRVCLDSQLPLPTTESAMLAPTAADTISGEQSAPLAKGKKSLLATIHAGQEQTNPLLKGGPASAKGSLLSQLTRKKKSPGD